MCPYFKELLVVVDIAGFIYPSSPKFKKKKKKKGTFIFPFVQFKLISLLPMKTNLSFACNVTCCSVTLPYCYSWVKLSLR